MGDTICQDKRGRKVAAEFTILCFEGLTVSKFLKMMKIGNDFLKRWKTTRMNVDIEYMLIALWETTYTFC